MDEFGRAVAILDERGPLALAREGKSYLARRLRDRRWQARGWATVSVGDASARFATRDSGECAYVRNLPRMEAAMLEAFVAELRTDDVVFDVGSHMGLFACLAADRAAEVVAFEPDPRLRGLLETNVALNDADAVRVEPIALAAADGTAALDNPARDEDASSGTASIAPEGAAGAVEVTIARGDGLVADGALPRPDVVKVDVEGAEPLVVDGLRETLRDDVRTLFLELHEPAADARRSVADYDATSAAVRETLRELGFEITELGARDADVHLRAWKP